ncbi:DUF6973 domain-containing protein [Nocardia iowensis]|uniref:DUF6973 domain-containing protein n=1 Tax=Nocardia iowensis TaxID=204891 RepID=A0ABX8RFZ2_NOCIO|nr:hypothetical protein [Nocardia iowensis]QXN88513.1 hypothetical protein KV110_23240 [Nocardia iowensis]
MITFQDVRRWDADAIEKVGRKVRDRKNALLGLSDELAGAALYWRWRGYAADAAKREVASLNDRAEHIVAEVSTVQRVLFATSDEVQALKQRVLNVEAFASGRQYSIAGDGTVADRSPEGPANMLRLLERQQIEDTVKKIVQRAVDIDRNLGKAMTDAANAAISDRGATSLAGADQTTKDIMRRYQVTPDPDGMVKYPINPLLRPFVDEQRVTVTEAKMLDKLGLPGQLKMKDIRGDAFSEANKRFPGYGVSDNHNDAFRHAYWNALMTREYGADWTKRFATAHERVPGNQPEQEAMDLHNNEVGRKIASANPNASPEQLAGLVEKAVKNGETVVVQRGGGDLQYSDRVAPGQAGHPKLPPPEPGEPAKSK